MDSNFTSYLMKKKYCCRVYNLNPVVEIKYVIDGYLNKKGVLITSFLLYIN